MIATMTVLERIQQVVFAETGISAEEVNPETPLRILTTDSLEAVSLLLELENEFGIDVPEEELKKFLNIQDMIDYVAHHNS